MASWKHLRARERFERLQEAINKGFIKPEEVEPDHIDIPLEPDPNWTDKPMGKTVRRKEDQ